MLCDNCERGLGIVDSGYPEYVDIRCPVCQGLGRLCSVCFGNPLDCGHEDEEDERPTKT